MKKYTNVSYKKINDELAKFAKFGQELSKDEPDLNSEVWQVASNMLRQLEAIKSRAMRLEREFSRDLA